MAVQSDIRKSTLENSSVAELLASESDSETSKFLKGLTDNQVKYLAFDWSFWGRPNQQIPEGDWWRIWLLMAGRGAGKTRTGAETIRQWKEQYSRIHLVAPTAGDVRDVMVEGESGLLACAPEWDRPNYEPSKRRITWDNGAVGILFSADEPDRLRGPQCEACWADELGSWRYPEAWDMLMLGLRLGPSPRAIVTTTPKPLNLIRSLVAREDKDVVVTRGSTYDNISNLAPAFIEQIIAQYEGTRLGQQEIYAELLSEAEGALWKRDLFRYDSDPPEMRRIVVAIDPAATSTESADETGIVVAGIDEHFKGWILADNSGRYSPKGWASRAIALYREFNADRIVAETNNGGEMVEATLRTVDPSIAYKAVHASRGKAARAEPIAAKYEQAMVTHVRPFSELEDQLCSWEPLGKDRSPDRLDALVWALTDLMLTGSGIDVDNIDFVGALENTNPGWDLR